MIDVKVNDAQFKADMLTCRQDQMPFAFSLAINLTAVGARDLMRAEVTKEFSINPSHVPFMQSLIRFPRSQWATKTKLSATFGVHTSDSDVGVGSSDDRGFLLGRHEDGGERDRPEDRPFFIPTSALRQGDTDLPPRSMYPTALRLFEGIGIVAYVKDVNGKRRGVKGILPAQAQGKRGTFIIDNRATGGRAWGIFQRTGRGKRDIRMIWAFRTRINLPPRLNFYPKVQEYVDQNFEKNLGAAITQAMRTAK